MGITNDSRMFCVKYVGQLYRWIEFCWLGVKHEVREKIEEKRKATVHGALWWKFLKQAEGVASFDPSWPSAYVICRSGKVADKEP